VIDVAGDLPRSAVNRLVDRAMTRRGVHLIPLERRARELRARLLRGDTKRLLATPGPYPGGIADAAYSSGWRVFSRNSPIWGSTNVERPLAAAKTSLSPPPTAHGARPIAVAVK
jgi:hypothetical protein